MVEVEVPIRWRQTNSFWKDKYGEQPHLRYISPEVYNLALEEDASTCDTLLGKQDDILRENSIFWFL